MAIGATSRPAHAAATALTTVSAVEYNGVPSQLLIQLTGGVNYIGAVSAGAGCTANNQSVDTLKTWTSMGQSALLSGKKLKIYFNTCGGVNYISTVDIWQ